MTTTEPELVYDPDPHLWLVGPTDSRPVDDWIPGAVDAVIEDFCATETAEVEVIVRVLQKFAHDQSSLLTERLLRWRNLHDDPFPVQMGMIERAQWPDYELEAFLASTDEPVVEPAIVQDVECKEGMRIRRGIAYSSDDGVLVAAARYVIESPSKTMLAVLHTATDVPGQLIEALDDLDNLARTVDVRGEIA